MDVSFTLGEIEERDIEMAARPGQENISMRTCTRFCLFFVCCLFFPYIPSFEAHKQFGAEPAQYGLEINFKPALYVNQSLATLSIRRLLGSIERQR